MFSTNRTQMCIGMVYFVMPVVQSYPMTVQLGISPANDYKVRKQLAGQGTAKTVAQNEIVPFYFPR